MTDIFKHLFGGWREAAARRWHNPDGSEGGIVAVSASVPNSVTIPPDCVVWPKATISTVGALIGDRASIGEGASIGVGASIGYRASIGDRASIGNGALIGYRASIGDGVKYNENDWIFVLGPQGSRGAWATAVYSAKLKSLRWWVGCQYGISTETLRERVELDHGASTHGDDYRAAIDFVESHPGLKRARAEILADEIEGAGV